MKFVDCSSISFLINSRYQAIDLLFYALCNAVISSEKLSAQYFGFVTLG